MNIPLTNEELLLCKKLHNNTGNLALTAYEYKLIVSIVIKLLSKQEMCDLLANKTMRVNEMHNLVMNNMFDYNEQYDLTNNIH